MVTSLLIVIFASMLIMPSIRGRRSCITKANDDRFNGSTGLIFLDFLNVTASTYYAHPGTIIHVYVKYSVTWNEYGSYWVEARYNGSAVGRKTFILLIMSGTTTDTIDFAWNTTGLDPGAYLISAAASTYSSYEDDYVHILQTLTVPDDYATIQAAINAANEGDTVLVRSGTYEERLNVTKRLVILGENSRNTTVIGFEISANNVNVSGFTMNALSYIGVFLHDARRCNISHNVVNADFNAIVLVNSSDNYVIGNYLLYSVNGWGIFLMSSNSNILHQNRISQQEAGILLLDAHHNLLDGNTLIDNYWGVYLDGSQNRIYHNNLVNNQGGVVDHGGNTWDNGCEGNYWSCYNGTDLDGDGVGDMYLPWEGVDHYPLMNPYWTPGDVDHDLDVDIFDVVVICNAYGATPADPRWNPHGDIAAPYGVIDIFDVVRIAMSYGEKYSP